MARKMTLQRKRTKSSLLLGHAMQTGEAELAGGGRAGGAGGKERELGAWQQDLRVSINGQMVQSDKTTPSALPPTLFAPLFWSTRTDRFCRCSAVVRPSLGEHVRFRHRPQLSRKRSCKKKVCVACRGVIRLSGPRAKSETRAIFLSLCWPTSRRKRSSGTTSAHQPPRRL